MAALSWEHYYTWSKCGFVKSNHTSNNSLVNCRETFVLLVFSCYVNFIMQTPFCILFLPITSSTKILMCFVFTGWAARFSLLISPFQIFWLDPLWHVTHRGWWTLCQNFKSLALTVWKLWWFENVGGQGLCRCYYPHLSKDLVSPVCGIFNRPGVAGAVLQTPP